MEENKKEEKQEIKFEEALARLEAIVAQLEEGMRLNKLCQAKLKEAEQKIERLVRKEDGSLAWEQKS